VRRRRLGAELRRLREAAGLTGDQVVERIGWASSSKVSRIENGRSSPDPADVADLLEVYGVTGRRREQLVAIARDASNTRGWLRAYPVMTKRQRGYAELEAGCSEIREYGQLVVPGLLQAPGYARWRILGAQALGPAPQPSAEPPRLPSAKRSRLPSAQPAAQPPVPRPVGDIDAEVAARGARQGLLMRADPPRYEAVLEESAFTRRAGPPEVLTAQLDHLCRLADLDHVTLRVLPPSAIIGDWYVPATSFSIYEFTDPEDQGTVAIEALSQDVLLADGPTLRQYLRVFDWLRDAARSPEESRRWLAEAADAVRRTAETSGATRPTVGSPGSPGLPPARRITGTPVRQATDTSTGPPPARRAGGDPAIPPSARKIPGDPAGPSAIPPPAKGGNPAGRPAAPPTQRGPRQRRVEPHA
jgi:transcriptional regulator with XRE-family HTH domain